MRYVVTGAAGFIGSHLAEALLAAGHEVVGIDSFTDYYDPALKERNASGIDVKRLDLARDELDFTGWDGVFHLAGQPGVRSFGDVFTLYVERNVLASQRVFEAAADAGTRVVFASSSSIYGEAEQYPTPEETPPRPLSPYGITKLACEHLARASGTSLGLDAVVLRYFNAYGPRQRPDMAFPRVVDALLEGRPFTLFGDGEHLARASGKSLGLDAVVLRYFNAYGPRQRPDMAFPRVVDALLEGRPFTLFGDGEQSRSFTYVRDVVAASIVAMERAQAGSVYNVGGGQEATMNETIALLEGISGRRLDVQRADAVAGDQRRTKADTTRIRDELGWQPTTSLENGLRAQWDWAAVESPA